MNGLNTLIIEGNLVRDPEGKIIKESTKVCTFDIAVQRTYKADNEYLKEVTYIQIETWGPLAESCERYLEKGRPVRVVGRLKQSRWKDPEGKYRERYQVVAEHVDFLPISQKKQESPEAPTEKPREKAPKKGSSKEAIPAI